MQQCEVADGETLVSISIREKVSVTSLRRLNKLYGNEIFPGQILSLRISPKTSEDSAARKLPVEPKFIEMANFNDFTLRGVTDHRHGILSHVVTDNSGDDPVTVVDTTTSDDRAAFPEKLSEIAKNVRSSVAFSFDTKQASMRSFVNSLKIPIVDNESYGRSRAPSASSVATLSVSFTDKKLCKKENYNEMTPLLLGDSNILTEHHAKQLRAFLPSMQQIENWRLLYSVLNDGADLHSFFRKSKHHKYTILIARTINGEIFGGFNSVEWSKSSTNFCKYYSNKTDCFILNFYWNINDTTLST